MFALLVIIIVAYLVYRGNELGYFDKFKEDKAVEIVKTIKSHSGRYVGTVTPPDNNVWGDGTHPDEAKVLVEIPHYRGLGYRLGGSFDISVSTDGTLSGNFLLWGENNSINVGQIPAGSNTVSIVAGGATAELTFIDGKVTGKIIEPHDPIYKYGNVSGSIVA